MLKSPIYWTVRRSNHPTQIYPNLFPPLTQIPLEHYVHFYLPMGNKNCSPRIFIHLFSKNIFIYIPDAGFIIYINNIHISIINWVIHAWAWNKFRVPTNAFIMLRIPTLEGWWVWFVYIVTTTSLKLIENIKWWYSQFLVLL